MKDSNQIPESIGGSAAGAGSDKKSPTFHVLRLVIQLQDTPANRAALLETHKEIINNLSADGEKAIIKLEQVGIVSAHKPLRPNTQPQPTHAE